MKVMQKKLSLECNTFNVFACYFIITTLAENGCDHPGLIWSIGLFHTWKRAIAIS